MKISRRKFIGRVGTAAFGMGLLPVIKHPFMWPLREEIISRSKATPESQGVSSSSIRNFIRAANESGFDWHSFMFLRHGKVIAEGWWKPFAPSYKHTLYSLSKSFTSTAIGLAVKEGRLFVDDSVLSFFNEEKPEKISENLKKMQVKHLLTMTTGHDTDSFPVILKNYEVPWTKSFFSHPVDHEPGTHFVYNTGATFMLSAILQKVTGQKLEDYLKPRLFDPLGITDYDWEQSPEGYNAGGFGLRVNTEAIARFGQLYLQKGKWDNKEIIPANWVKDATSKQTPSFPGDGDWSQGYGYQFWRCTPGFYRGDGAYGQFCIVMPQYDAVVAVTSESWDLPRSMKLMWEHLLPGMSDKPALAKNNQEYKALKKELSNLSIKTPTASKTSGFSKKIDGKHFKLEPNDYGIESVKFEFNRDNCIWTTNTNKATNSIACGLEQWKVNEPDVKNLFKVFFRTHIDSRIAASATWIDEQSLQMNLKFVETIHGDKITCKFKEDKLEIEFLNSVAEFDNNVRNAEKRLPLHGKLIT